MFKIRYFFFFYALKTFVGQHYVIYLLVLLFLKKTRSILKKKIFKTFKVYFVVKIEKTI